MWARMSGQEAQYHNAQGTPVEERILDWTTRVNAVERISREQTQVILEMRTQIQSLTEGMASKITVANDSRMPKAHLMPSRNGFR